MAIIKNNKFYVMHVKKKLIVEKKNLRHYIHFAT